MKSITEVNTKVNNKKIIKQIIIDNPEINGFVLDKSLPKKRRVPFFLRNKKINPNIKRILFLPKHSSSVNKTVQTTQTFIKPNCKSEIENKNKETDKSIKSNFKKIFDLQNINQRGVHLNTINNNFNNKPKKFSFVDFRRKKYFTNRHIIKSDFDFPEETEKEGKNPMDKLEQYLNSNFINPGFQKKDLIIGYHTYYNKVKSQMNYKNILYKDLPIRANYYMNYLEQIEKKNLSLPKTSKLKVKKLVFQNNFFNYRNPKPNYNKLIDSTNQNLCYLSSIKNNEDGYNLSESEKVRYQKTMETFIDVKKYVEQNPKKEHDIVKDFLIQKDIKDRDSLVIEKIDNFVKFIKSDFKVNPKKTMRQNIIDILEYKGNINNKIKNKDDRQNKNKGKTTEGFYEIKI